MKKKVFIGILVAALLASIFFIFIHLKPVAKAPSTPVAYGGFNGSAAIAQPYTINGSGGNSSTSTNFFGSVNPQKDNLYDLGTSTLRWRNLNIAGSVSGGSVSSSNLTWTNATGSHTTSTDLFATTGRFTTATSTTMNGNNITAGSLIFAYGTSTQNFETGGLVSSPDAGKLSLWISKIGNTATGTFQGAAIGTDVFPDMLTVGCFSGGASDCQSGGYAAVFKVALAFPVSATTTVTTSTLLDPGFGRHAVVSGNPTTSTFPIQLFATSTLAATSTISGTENETVGTSSTAMVVVSDTTANDVYTNGLTCYLGKMTSVTWRWSPMFLKWYIYAMSPGACK